MLRRFAAYLGTREGKVSSALVVVTGAVLGVFLCLTFVDRIPKQYGLDFGTARWIQRAGARRLDPGYFRGTIYIPGVVTAGWIQIAATGGYALYVNDMEVGSNTYSCVRATGVYDLKEILAPGKNVIAVYVAGGKYPSPVQLLVRGAYRVASSAPQEFTTGPDWKVAPFADGIVSSFPWSSQALNDRLWENAIVTVPHERFSTIQPLAFDPAVIEAPPRAQWIEGRAERRNESFLHQITVPAGRPDTWLQVAATGAYDVVVNGRLAAAQPAVADTRMVGPQTPLMAAPGEMVPSGQMPKSVTPNSTLAGSVNPSVTAVASLVPPAAPVPSAASLLAAANLTATQPTINPTVDVQAVSTTTSPSIAPPSTVQSAATQAALAQVTALSDEANALMLRNTAVSPDNAEPDDVDEMPDLSSITPALQDSVAQLIAPPLYLGMTGTTPLLLAYNLTNWVHTGDNSIVIRVRNHYGPALLYAQGYANLAGAPTNLFATDSAWRTPARRGAGATDAVRVITNYGGQALGVLPQVAANPQAPPGYMLRRLGRWTGSLALSIGLVGLLWWGVSSLLAGLLDEPVEPLWNNDALLHLPLLLGLLFLWLFSYDARIWSDWCFIPPVVIGSAVYVIASKVLLLVVRTTPRPDVARGRLLSGVARTRLALGCLVVIMAVGCAIRAAGMLTVSLGHDESGMIFFSWAVLKHGLPWVPSGSFRRWLSTYELVPYPMALSSLIFGTTEFAYRFPSLVFSTLIIGVIGWFGYRLRDWRVGLLAALIYACLPMAINWGQDGFYPSQQNLLSTLTFLFFYEAIRKPGLDGKYITYTGIALTFTYFSWEGSGFMIPVLLVLILVHKWGEFEWMADAHLWRVFSVVVAIVIIQLSYRQIVTTPDYLTVGRNLSEMTSPRLAFLDRLVYNPYFYLQSEFLVENHFTLTVFFLIGVIVAWREPAMLYLFVALLMLEIMYTNFLAAYAVRYCFSWTPLLVLAAVGTFFYIVDRVRELNWTGGLGAFVGTASCYAGGALLILGANPFGLKLYRLSANPPGQTYFCRLGANFKPDYRAAFLYVAQHASPGDAIVSDGPACHVFRFYASEWPDFTMDTRLISRNTYDGGIATPRYRDRFGLPMVRSLQDLVLTNSQSGRVWVVGQGDDSPKVRAFTSAKGRNYFETAAQKVVAFTGVPATSDFSLSPERTGMDYETDFFPRPWAPSSLPLPSRTRDRALIVSPEPQSPDGATPVTTRR